MTIVAKIKYVEASYMPHLDAENVTISFQISHLIEAIGKMILDKQKEVVIAKPRIYTVIRTADLEEIDLRGQEEKYLKLTLKDNKLTGQLEIKSYDYTFITEEFEL